MLLVFNRYVGFGGTSPFSSGELDLLVESADLLLGDADLPNDIAESPDSL